MALVGLEPFRVERRAVRHDGWACNLARANHRRAMFHVKPLGNVEPIRKPMFHVKPPAFHATYHFTHKRIGITTKVSPTAPAPRKTALLFAFENRISTVSRSMTFNTSTKYPTLNPMEIGSPV